MPAFPERSASGSEKQRLAPQLAQAAQSDLLAQYGITSVTTTTFEWGGYRYTNAPDAIAAAKRGESL